MNHSKYKNTGLIFELLVRKVTQELLSGISEGNSVKLIKKYFKNTELGKEYKLYETLIKQNKNIKEDNLNIIIETLLNLSKKLNRTKIRNERYNLIKEIKENYNIDEFFKIRINNYRVFSSFSNLIESINSDSFNPEFITKNRITILEDLKGLKNNVKKEDGLLEEYEKSDKDIKLLTYRIISEKYNEKYKSLNENQKEVLRNYITSVDSEVSLKEFYNKCVKEIKEELDKCNIQDQVLNIKLNEISKLLNEIEKNDKVKKENIETLLKYYELTEELNNLK